MTASRLTPEEFARLVALPENHPDRRRAVASPEFEAHLRLLQEFESPANALLPAGELAAGARELEARLVDAVRPGVGAGVRLPRRSWLAAWTRPLWASAPRAAFSIATVMVVAAAFIWLATHDESRRVRGEAVQATIGIARPRVTGVRVEIAWTAVPGADAYRLIFYGSDMKELARMEPLSATTLVLRTDSLPIGLHRDSDVLVEVTALQNTDPIATSASRPMHLP